MLASLAGAGVLALGGLPARAMAQDGGQDGGQGGRQGVDLVLLMAIDASASISRGTLDFQLRGHAAAFRDPAVARAITGGSLGRIAVQLAQFAGPETLTTLLPWTVLTGEGDCLAFADRVDAAPGIAMGGSTAIGSAMVAAVQTLDTAPFAAPRRTLDIVSNGFSNAGIDLPSARGHAAAAGVTVNALAILDEFDWLEAYYRDKVVTGQGAFVRTAAGMEDFAAAFRDKLVTEIA